MKKALVIILLGCISLLGSCGKIPFSNGEEREYDRQLEQSFHTIDIGDNFNVKLLHSDADHPAGWIHIKTGDKLIDGVRTEVEGDTLFVRNDNAAAFIRPYDYPREMTIYYDTLLQLIINSNAECIETDTLRGYKALTQFTHDTLTYDSLVPNLYVLVMGGSGNFNVLTNCYRVAVKYFHGTSTINIKGMAESASIYGDYDCHGIIDAAEWKTDLLSVTNYGTNVITGKAFTKFSAVNDNIGLVHYVRYYEWRKKIIWGHFEGPHWVPNDTIDTLYYCPLRVVKQGSYAENITSIHEGP